MTAPPTTDDANDPTHFCPNTFPTPKSNALPTPKPTTPPTAPSATFVPSSLQFSAPHSPWRVPFANPTICATALITPIINAPCNTAATN
ncbi:hypothetical protein ABT160_10290 [Streptomyces sp. NPDC001941]|uniref:hypothetical protein n=1 Tax=Streptomyces sp. NPDC001941 TaxID=3154659 RepID=UPI0033169214